MITFTPTSWGNSVRTLRTFRKMTIARFAAATGISPARVSRLEHDNAPLTEIDKAIIAKVLGATVAELFPPDVYPGGGTL